MTRDKPWRERFAALVNDYQGVFGGRAALQLPDDGDVSLTASWRNVAFELLHSTTRSPAHLFIRCGFGRVPPENAQAVLLRLLHIQRTLTPSAASTLGIDAANGEVSHVEVLPLGGADLPQLLATMQRMMLRTSEWRASYFLDEEDGVEESSEVRTEPVYQTH